MRVATKTLEEARHLLVHHRVALDAVFEVRGVLRRRQLAVQQEVTGLEKGPVLGDLLDRVAAIEQHAGIAVDVGDGGFTARGGGKAGIVGEHAGLRVELRDVRHGGPHRPFLDGQVQGLAGNIERSARAAHERAFQRVKRRTSSAEPAEVGPTCRAYCVAARLAYRPKAHKEPTGRKRHTYNRFFSGRLIAEATQAFLAAQHNENVEDAGRDGASR